MEGSHGLLHAIERCLILIKVVPARWLAWDRRTGKTETDNNQQRISPDRCIRGSTERGMAHSGRRSYLQIARRAAGWGQVETALPFRLNALAPPAGTPTSIHHWAPGRLGSSPCCARPTQPSLHSRAAIRGESDDAVTPAPRSANPSQPCTHTHSGCQS